MALSLSPDEIVERDEHPLLRISTNWDRVRLGDIATVQNGFPFKSTLFSVESGFPLIRIRDVGRGETQHFYTGEYDDEFIVGRDDILIGMDGDFRAARWRGPDALLNQRVCRLKLETQNYDERFFLVCLQPYLDAVNAETSSVTVKHLSSKTVQDLPLPLPPLNEQRRIVEKIEAMFDEIDKGVESLQTARTTLGLYRQSLLKSAFEGRLTADWRAQNADKLEAPKTLLARIQAERDARYKAALETWQDALAEWRAGGDKGKKPAKPKRPAELALVSQEELALLPDVPPEWIYTKLANLGDLGRGKSKHRPRNDKRLFGGPYPFIQTGEVKAAGRYITEYVATYSDFGLEQSKLWPAGTLCITIAANIAETAFLTFEACFPDSVVGFATFEEIMAAKFVELFIKSARVNIEAYAPTTAQKNINLHTLETLVVPLCGQAEQAEIVRRLDARLEAADALDSEIDAALTRANALRQSILKKAFSGQLVPKDPDDEPASALLERIKAEKAERDQTAKRDRKSAPSRKPKARRPTMTDLIEVLATQKSWISASKAAQELGISDGASSDDVEAFYRQLKDYVEAGAIEVERRGDEDWLRLVKAEVA